MNTGYFLENYEYPNLSELSEYNKLLVNIEKLKQVEEQHYQGILQEINY